MLKGIDYDGFDTIYLHAYEYMLEGQTFKTKIPEWAKIIYK